MLSGPRALLSASEASEYMLHEYLVRNDDAHRTANRWHGRGAAALSLPQRVSRRRFVSILEGRVPGTDIRLGRVVDGEWQHRPGWDVTFSAPKSVSLEALLYGNRAVLRPHDAAVRATLDWVEAEFLQTRGYFRARSLAPRQELFPLPLVRAQQLDDPIPEQPQEPGPASGVFVHRLPERRLVAPVRRRRPIGVILRDRGRQLAQVGLHQEVIVAKPARRHELGQYAQAQLSVRSVGGRWRGNGPFLRETRRALPGPRAPTHRNRTIERQHGNKPEPVQPRPG